MPPNKRFTKPHQDKVSLKWNLVNEAIPRAIHRGDHTVDKMLLESTEEGQKILKGLANHGLKTEDYCERLVAGSTLLVMDEVKETFKPLFRRCLIKCIGEHGHSVKNGNTLIKLDFEIQKADDSLPENNKKLSDVFANVRDVFLRDFGQDFCMKVTLIEKFNWPLRVAAIVDDKYREVSKYDRLIDIFGTPKTAVANLLCQQIKCGFTDAYFSHIVTPSALPPIDNREFLISRTEGIIKLKRIFDTNGMNDSQLEAVQNAVFQKHGQSPLIIHGPPGTGKTSTLAKMVIALTAHNTGNLILICTASNDAADNAALKILENLELKGAMLSKNQILRFVSRSRSFENRNKGLDGIYNSANSISIDTYDSEKCFDTENFKSMITGRRVLICTIGIVTSFLKEHLNCTHLLVDEASQVTETELWIPVLAAAKRSISSPTSIILFGDPKQLGPVITMQLPDTVTHFVSAIDSYMKHPTYQNDRRRYVLLDTCYRCPPHITTFASRFFYDFKLKCGRFIGNKIWKIGGFQTKFPIVFYLVNGSESKIGDSYYNKMEAKKVSDCITGLVKENGIQAKDVGIVSPYNVQTDLIKTNYLQGKFSDVTVGSVEKFQGSERPCIIITTTRTTVPGFIADDLRTNTAITRTQELLVVIGHKKMLETVHKYRALMQYCENNGTLIGN